MYCPRDSKIITRFFAQFCLDNHAQRITSPQPTTKPSRKTWSHCQLLNVFKASRTHKSMSFSSRELSLVESKLTSSCADRYSLVVDVIYPFISCRLPLQLSCWRGWSSRGNQIVYWTARRVHKCLSKPWPVADMKRRGEGSKSRLEEWTAQQRKAWPPF